MSRGRADLVHRTVALKPLNPLWVLIDTLSGRPTEARSEIVRVPGGPRPHGDSHRAGRPRAICQSCSLELTHKILELGDIQRSDWVKPEHPFPAVHSAPLV